MKRRSNTKPPHDPHVLYLDEDTSGDRFASLLRHAKLSVQLFESLLPKNKKTPDATVIERAARSNYVLVTTDKRMESDWIEDIILNKARVILLTDDDGGPIHWASALICSESRWSRVLLDHPGVPITIRVERAGKYHEGGWRDRPFAASRPDIDREHSSYQEARHVAKGSEAHLKHRRWDRKREPAFTSGRPSSSLRLKAGCQGTAGEAE